MAETLLELVQLSCHFRQGEEYLAAVDGVNLRLAKGEVLGLVGESGSGKSTLGRLVVGMETPSSGVVKFAGEPLFWRRHSRLPRRHQGKLQMVFQDSYASLDPRMTIAQSLAEPLRAAGMRGNAVAKKTAQWLDRVGLGERFARRYPHEMSGGQRQRVGIARAFISEPKLVVCDEAVSALDVSVQAQVLQLLREIQAELGTAMIFITHDLAVLRGLADRIAVMYLGEVLELAPSEQLLNRPLHPYTQQLLAAHPEPEVGGTAAREVSTKASERPMALSNDRGCRFAGRCPYVQEACLLTPPWLETDNGVAIACHRREYLAGREGSAGGQ